MPRIIVSGAENTVIQFDAMRPAIARDAPPAGYLIGSRAVGYCERRGV